VAERTPKFSVGRQGDLKIEGVKREEARLGENKNPDVSGRDPKKAVLR